MTTPTEQQSSLNEPLNSSLPVVVSVNVVGDQANEREVENEIKGYEAKINYDIGYYWWKRYVAGAVWNNIATPISLAITIITALTTGQAATKDLISDEAAVRLGMGALIISTLNTFFRPAQQLMDNMEKMKLWSKMGTEFEKIYFNKVYSYEEKAEKLKNYQDIFNQVNDLKRDTATNFFTDLIYLISRCCCMSDGVDWIKDDDNCYCMGREINCMNSNQAQQQQQ